MLDLRTDLQRELVIRASSDLSQFGHLTRGTCSAIEASLSFDDNIVYSVLHEPIYCQGHASNWSADRLLAKYPQFSPSPSNPGPIFFTGEMIYPFMFESYSELRKLSSHAHAIAKFKDWPRLYDTVQLGRNEVPVYAAVYVDDMYVDFDFALDTARKIRGCKTFITNAMYHDAVRSKMEDVIKAVWALRDDVID